MYQKNRPRSPASSRFGHEGVKKRRAAERKRSAALRFFTRFPF
ncbi:hypothetical protein HMPREF7215_0978, partial [Pyramidobacter piscolens W5455]